jgi:hypothetical protein
MGDITMLKVATACILVGTVGLLVGSAIEFFRDMRRTRRERLIDALGRVISPRAAAIKDGALRRAYERLRKAGVVK